MIVHKKKKNKRMRGSKTHGGGSMKKRRGAGNRGGRGNAGTGKRADVKKPSIKVNTYFGKYGFKKKNKTKIHAINIEYLEKFSEKLILDKKAQKSKDSIIIDLKSIKINKLLAKGTPKNKWEITCKYFSNNAKEKIEKAGGKVMEDKKKVEAKPEAKKEEKAEAPAKKPEEQSKPKKPAK